MPRLIKKLVCEGLDKEQFCRQFDKSSEPENFHNLMNNH